MFPTRLADVTLNDTSVNPSLYDSLKSIRRATLSIPKRLTSILADGAFVQRTAEHCHLPLVANERCGSWYIDPAEKVASAYFKSTDGHHAQWSFSLRRLNLHLLSVMGQHGGAVVVDSTRRGKNLPDAFSKTVPIWVAVMNRALFPERLDTHALQRPSPPDELGRSEVSQIEGRLDEFFRSFVDLGLDLQHLRRQVRNPIHITWAINGHVDFAQDVPSAPRGSAATCVDRAHLVLCSASRRVRGAEISEGGYIQGAGDDSEGWAHGLTPRVFWKYQTTLMQTPEGELVALIEHLLESDQHGPSPGHETITIAPTSNLHLGVGHVAEQVHFGLVINCHSDDYHVDAKLMDLRCRPGKLGSKDLREKLPAVSATVWARLSQDPDCQIMVTCTTGSDLSAGVVVALLCLFYDDQGRVSDRRQDARIDKSLVKQRLAWITCSKPDVNPSRATLQAVNSFLMQRPG